MGPVEYMRELEKLIDTIEGMGAKPLGMKGSLKDQFKADLHSFLMYLSASDGRVAPQEAIFMNQLFGVNASVSDYIRFIKNNGIYSMSFENHVPESLAVIAAFDTKIKELKGDEYDTPFFQLVMDYYQKIGALFIACDGNVAEQEIKDLATYCLKLQTKIELAARASSVSGIGIVPKNDDEDEEEETTSRRERTSESYADTNNGKKYGPSIYKVGVDIPAGKYKLFVSGGRGYYGICKDANCDNIVQNDNFQSQAYIDIHTGQFLELNRCYAMSIDDAPKFKAPGGVYQSGEYIVGVEIPAGEYRLVADGGRGYYGIEVFAGDGSRDIISNNNFSNAAYVEVRQGQILVLNRCTLKI